jgi:hypothetical protein
MDAIARNPFEAEALRQGALRAVRDAFLDGAQRGVSERVAAAFKEVPKHQALLAVGIVLADLAEKVRGGQAIELPARDYAEALAAVASDIAVGFIDLGDGQPAEKAVAEMFAAIGGVNG